MFPDKAIKLIIYIFLCLFILNFMQPLQINSLSAKSKFS